MTSNTPNHNPLTEAEIDRIVESQADQDSAWDEPIFVQCRVTTLPLPDELAQKAAFFAKLHRESNSKAWLLRIIQERLDLEEAALNQIKTHLTSASN